MGFLCFLSRKFRAGLQISFQKNVQVFYEYNCKLKMILGNSFHIKIYNLLKPVLNEPYFITFQCKCFFTLFGKVLIFIPFWYKGLFIHYVSQILRGLDCPSPAIVRISLITLPSFISFCQHLAELLSLLAICFVDFVVICIEFW